MEVRALGSLGIEGAQLVWVLAVAQIGLLLDHERQPAGEEACRSGVQVRGGDLGVYAAVRANASAASFAGSGLTVPGP